MLWHADINFTAPTEVQRAAIPVLLVRPFSMTFCHSAGLLWSYGHKGLRGVMHTHMVVRQCTPCIIVSQIRATAISSPSCKCQSTRTVIFHQLHEYIMQNNWLKCQCHGWQASGDALGSALRRPLQSFTQRAHSACKA